MAEDRERFQQMLHQLGLKQPANRIVRTVEEGLVGAAEIGYPLGGSALVCAGRAGDGGGPQGQ